MPDDPIIAFAKVQQKGLVQIPFEVRERLDLKPGTKMIVCATDDAVVLQKAEVLLERESPPGLIRRIRSMFSKVPIRDIEE